jgi:chemotaxis protein methyltransferase CheR
MHAMSMARDDELEAIELQLLLEGIFLRYGFDFRNYSLASLKRRVWNVIRSERLATISALQERVLHDPACMERLHMGLSVNVSSMFRDPGFFHALRTKILPMLRTYPFIRVWNAGCSTGEEAYSVAILLKEEGLYDRSRIYATDMNAEVLKRAKDGIFPWRRCASTLTTTGGPAGSGRSPNTTRRGTATPSSPPRCGTTSSSRSTTWRPTAPSTSSTWSSAGT